MKWYIVAAFGHFGTGNNVWINLGTGLVVFGLGLLARKLRPRLGQTAALLGLLVMVTAFVLSFMDQYRLVWIDGLGGLAVWFCGWRGVARDSGGSWRLKYRPVY